MPKNGGNGTGAGLTPFQRKTFLRTKPRFRPIFGGWTQFSNLLDGLEGAENLRFQGARQIQIADNSGRSSVPRELHNSLGTPEKKPCWYKRCAESSLLLSGTNHECRQKQIDGLFWSVIIKFSNNNILFVLKDIILNVFSNRFRSSGRDHRMRAYGPWIELRC